MYCLVELLRQTPPTSIIEFCSDAYTERSTVEQHTKYLIHSTNETKIKCSQPFHLPCSAPEQVKKV